MSIRYMKEGFFKAVDRLSEVMAWAFSGVTEFLIYCITLIVAMFVQYKEMITIICILSFVDWILAVINAIKRDNLQSTKMLSLVGKLTMYMIGFLMAWACNKFIKVDAFEWMITGSIFLGETISLVSNMILVWPNAPVLKIIDKLLKSELASKLNLSKEDVEDAIRTSTKKKRK